MKTLCTCVGVDLIGHTRYINKYSGARKSLIGNLVRIGDGPAAVIGDESRNKATVLKNQNGKVR